MRTVYIANDGKEFNDVYECKRYEWTLDYPGLNDVTFYDDNDKEMNDKFSENTYEYVARIIIPNKDALVAIQKLGQYTGFSCYEWIDSVGEWIWNYEVNKFKLKE